MSAWLIGSIGMVYAIVAADLILNGNSGLGIWPAPDEDVLDFSGYGDGDAGVVVYNCDTGKTRCYAGYLAEKNPDEINLDVPPG